MEHENDLQSNDREPGNLKIRRILAKNGVLESELQMNQLQLFVEQVLSINQTVNLISRKDTQNIWEAHILHSIGLVIQGEIPRGATVLDLGTGGGLPGIPVKILRPDISLSLLDATRKKVEAVTAIVAVLGLNDVRVEWGRAEDDATKKKFNRMFDVVIARAVAPLEDLVLWSEPMLRRGSGGHRMLIALKGGDLAGEMLRAKRMRGVGDVSAKELTFYGCEVIPGVEKKIVTVKFT